MYICSWAMGDKLIPYIHYIPLKHDFFDLEQQFQWALNNEHKCIQIINNSTKYINQFLDDKIENEIQQQIIKKYCENIEIIYK